jgi:aminoglycoside phosphotransferase (APT) family kinase protein
LITLAALRRPARDHRLASRPVDEDQLLASYLAAVQHASGGERPEFRHGQFHDVVLVGDVAYRFPRDDESRRALPGRVELLRVLGNCRLPVATPVPRATAPAALHEALGRCHVALSRLRGQPLEREQATSPQSEPVVIAELGRLLDALSELGADPAVATVVPGADPDRWVRFAGDVHRVLFPLMSDRGRRRAEAELAEVAAVDPGGAALVHGDLGGTNLLWTVSESGPHLAGVLDWDEAQLGNPADDLASLAATFGWPLAERLDATRHAGRCPTIGDARTIAATFALQQALPAALSGDTVMLADGLAGYVDQRPLDQRPSAG